MKENETNNQDVDLTTTATISRVEATAGISGQRGQSNTTRIERNALQNGVTAAIGRPNGLSTSHSVFLAAMNGKTYIEVGGKNNPLAIALSSSQADHLIHEEARIREKNLNKQGVTDTKYRLQSWAEMADIKKEIWCRVAPVAGGVELDLGDSTHARVRITAGKVETIAAGSDTIFYRTSAMMAMAKPTEIGNLDLLKKYVSLPTDTRVLLLAWLTYTMATPKQSVAKFPILVLQGGEGSGKSALSKLLIGLIDPSRLGVQTLHSNPKDFAIAAQSAHVIAFDNLRFLTHAMADLLCTASTGGNISCRALYTDEDQSVLRLHVAVILNGIPNVVDQPDLAQRTVQLHLSSIPDDMRKSDAEMANELAADLPSIQRGLFDLISKILAKLPHAPVTQAARMIDFSRWLASMELVDGATIGTYQNRYLDTLKQGQLDGLLDNVLAAEILKFTERQPNGGAWSGTPAAFLAELNEHIAVGMQYSKGWPNNPISLSKRLLPLQTALMSQGVMLALHRGKHRTITITQVANDTKSACVASSDQSSTTQDLDYTNLY